MNLAIKHVFLLLALLILGACHGGYAPLVPWDGLPEKAKRVRLVEAARQTLRTHRLESYGRRFPYDCSGLVGSILLENGIDVFKGASILKIRGNGVAIIHKFVRRYGEIFRESLPQPGDLVFFSNTWDRNRDHKLNDRLTHIGIVEKVDSDQTITIIHHLGGRFRRDVMNLKHPYVVQNSRGRKLNSYLRRRRRTDPKGTPHLAAGLFDGFGSLMPKASPGNYNPPGN